MLQCVLLLSAILSEELLRRHCPGADGLLAFLFAVVRCARTSRLYPQSDQMFAAASQQNFPLAPSDTA
jgi:hypothetical protein